jgi:hypothetical protein
MWVCREVSKVYHQNFSYGSATGGCLNPKNPETLKPYSTKTVLYKLTKIGMLRDNIVVYLMIASSLHSTLDKVYISKFTIFDCLFQCIIPGVRTQSFLVNRVTRYLVYNSREIGSEHLVHKVEKWQKLF